MFYQANDTLKLKILYEEWDFCLTSITSSINSTNQKPSLSYHQEHECGILILGFDWLILTILF